MAWLGCLRRYLIVLAAGNLAWEALHIPLYRLWETGTYRQIVLYRLHCFAGDLLITAKKFASLKRLATGF